MTDQISVNASATLAQGVGAHMEVIVDGQNIGSATVGTTPTTYSFATTLAPNTSHDVQIVYDNDTVINGQDRNLLLNSISINGNTIAATSGYETYTAPTQGTTVASDGNMYWNGTADFKLPASSFSAANGTTAADSTTAATTTTAANAAPPSSNGNGFYVSTSGSDGGDGSAAHPFATLAKAVSAMEGSGTHTTFVEGGTYYIGSTLHLGSQASGMTIESAPGSTATLDGSGSQSTLIQLDGASGVTLQGLTFQNTGGGGAAVTLNGASGNSIIDNHFTNTHEGLLVENGSNNNTVSGNELDNSGTSGVEVDNGSNSNSFDSNVINGAGATGTTGGGFFVHGGNDNSISHNLVENTAGVGIGIENWDSSTTNIGNKITDNIVQNTSTSSSGADSGAIYMLGRSHIDTQSVISGNYITGNATGTDVQRVGIYLDDLTSGVDVNNNIVAMSGTDAAQIHGGFNINIHNNIFDLGANSGSSWGHDGAVLIQAEGQSMYNDSVSGNIITSTSPNPLSYTTIDGGTASISNNFYMDQLNSSFRMDGPSLPESNAQHGNAQFANQNGGNYALGSNSGANSIGFASIDQSAMGPHPTTAHWYA